MTEGKGVTQHGPRVLRALLWKEWRQQRNLFLMIVFVPPILLAVASGNRDLPFADMAVMVWCALALLLGVNTFTVEEERETGRFLEGMPVSRTKVFGVKLAVTFALLGIALALGTPFYRALHEHFAIPPKINHVLDFIIGFCCVALVLLPAMVTQLTRSSVACLFTSGLIACPMMVWVFCAAFWYADRLDAERSCAHVDPWRFALVLLVSLAALLAVCFRIWLRGRNVGLLRRIFSVVVACTVVMFVSVTLVAGTWVREAFFQEPADYTVKGAPWGSHNIQLYASPAGNGLIGKCHDQRWYYPRTAWMNADTGKWQWVDKLACTNTATHWWGSPWSPDGKRFVVWQRNVWVGRHRRVPEALRDFFSTLPWQVKQKSELWICEVQPFGKQRLTALVPEFIKFESKARRVYGWLDASTLMIGLRDSIVFADIVTGKLSHCAFPKEMAGKYGRNLMDWWRLYKTSRGCILPWARNAKDSPQEPWLLFSPEIKEAQQIPVRIDGDYLAVRQISPHGNWALVSVHDVVKGLTLSRTVIVSLTTGKVITLKSVGKGDERLEQHVDAFISEELVLVGLWRKLSRGERVMKGMGLFNLRTRELHELKFSGYYDSRIIAGRRILLAPSEKYAAIHTRFVISRNCTSCVVLDAKTGQVVYALQRPTDSNIKDVQWFGQNAIMWHDRESAKIWRFKEDKIQTIRFDNRIDQRELFAGKETVHPINSNSGISPVWVCHPGERLP